MNAFITGITGFAGSHLAEHLLESGDRVLGTSRSGKWPAFAPGSLSADAAVFACDLGGGDCRELRERMTEFRPDWIFHVAGMSIPADCGAESPTPPAQRVNVGGTQAIVDLAAQLAARPRLVLVSSSHVYGNAERAAETVAESRPLRLRGGYSHTKAEAERIVREAGRMERIDGVIARAFHHAGPRQLPRLLVSEWARQFAAADKHLPVRVRTLDVTLDLSDVRDVVRAYRLLAERGETGQCYNVGSGIETSGGEIFDLFVELSGAARTCVQSAPGPARLPIADCTRLFERTGWRPAIPLRRTLADTLAFWQGGPHW